MSRADFIIPVVPPTRAGLTRARVELANRLAQAYGVPRGRLRIPQYYAALYSAPGQYGPDPIRLSTYVDEQASRQLVAGMTIRLHPDIQVPT